MGTDADFGAEATLHGGDPSPHRAPPQNTAPDPRIAAEFDRSSLSQRERSLQLTRYMLLRRLGAGGMGVVYQAYDPRLDRKVAIKLLRAAAAEGPVPDPHARLLREAQALAKLSHPNVVAVHDVGTYDAEAITTLRIGKGAGSTEPDPKSKSDAPLGVFLVMEYVPGQTLAQWLEQRGRTAREILEVFLAAGRGLMAAHAVGVIHRDFKPGNVLVSEAGRVCVFDFGLARAAGEADPLASGPAWDPLTSAQLSAPLTRVGSLVGTPAYAAPEQRGGEASDERADQFSFCAALYEGLYDVRPFQGDTIFALEQAKALGQIASPRGGRRVPAAAHRAILRGMAPDPKDRWPTMAELLAALERSLRRGRHLALAGGALALAGFTAGGALLLAEGEAPPPRCTGADGALAPAWGPERRASITAAFVATGLAYARDAAERATAGLDVYAAAWIAGHTDACEATSVRGEQSPALLDRRMRCLELRRRDLAALVDVLGAADAGVVEHALDAIESLAPVEGCADIDALLADTQPPPTHEIAGEVEVIRGELTVARAELAAGRTAAGLARAEAAAKRAAPLEYRPLRVEVTAELIDQRVSSSKFEGLERLLQENFWDALATRRDDAAFSAAATLSSHLARTLARPEEGRLWLGTAEALAERLGRPRASMALLAGRRGDLAEATNDCTGAIGHYRQAISLGLSLPERTQRMTGLANCLMFLGRLDDAEATWRELDALYRGTYGPGHPSVALSLAGLANLALFRGDFAASERLSREGLSLLRASLPPEHERLAFPLSALGDLALQRGDLSAALGHFGEARTIWEHNFGPEHTRVAAMLERLASVEAERGEVGLAEQHATRALAIWGDSEGRDAQGVVLAHLTLATLARARGDHRLARTHIDVALPIAEAAFGAGNLISASVRAQRALCLMHLGALAEAEREADDAVRALEETYGPSSLWLGEVLRCRSEIHVARRRLAEARTDLERALTIVSAETAPLIRAELEFHLARVLWEDPGERPRARALVESARQVVRRSEASVRRATIEAWLAAHPT